MSEGEKESTAYTQRSAPCDFTLPSNYFTPNDRRRLNRATHHCLLYGIGTLENKPIPERDFSFGLVCIFAPILHLPLKPCLFLLACPLPEMRVALLTCVQEYEGFAVPAQARTAAHPADVFPIDFL